ncbi:MAG: hemerythrin domain-containing protein [Nonomuraea sp.]|nr:hemerythrin domain-containing protein [Nonomuraea sp.]
MTKQIRDPLFDELIRIHAWMREQLAVLRRGEAADLREHCLMFCQALTRHHTGEDRVIFPRLAAEHPELIEALDRLRREHVVVAELLRELSEAPESDLGRLTGELEAHFAYEEDVLALAWDGRA